MARPLLWLVIAGLFWLKTWTRRRLGWGCDYRGPDVDPLIPSP